jgi:hypothetical protein
MPANWGRNEIGEHSVLRAYCWSLCSLRAGGGAKTGGILRMQLQDSPPVDP